MKKIYATAEKRSTRAIAVADTTVSNGAATPFAGVAIMTATFVTGCFMLSSPAVPARVADVVGMTNHILWLAAFLLSGTHALRIFRSAKAGE